MTKKRIVILLVFVVLFIYGISNTTEYGRPWDEQDEIAILLANVKEYGNHPLIQRIVNSTWLKYLKATPIGENIERDHGIAAYYGFVPFFYHIGYDTRPLMYAWHYYTFVLWFIGVIAIYGLQKEVFKSRILPIVGTVFFYFTPRLFADGHYNNKDIAFLVFVIVALLFAARLIKYGYRRDLLLFAFSSGFLMNTKILGVAIWGLIVVFISIHFWMNRTEHFKSDCLGIFCAVILSLLWYYLLTPAMWRNPIAFLEYCVHNATHFSRWNGTFLYYGRILNPADNGIPYSYLPVWMLITTPVYISLLFLISVVLFLYRAVKTRGRILHQYREFMMALFLMLFCFPFFHIILHAPTTVLYNAWRHCYFLYAPLFLIAMYVFDDALQELRFVDTDKRVRARGLVAAVCVGFIFTAGDMVQNRSFEYSYYNRAARTVLDPSAFEGDYWNVSVLPALKQFADQYYDGQNLLKVTHIRPSGGGQEWSFEEMRYDDGRIETVTEEEADFYLLNPSIMTDRKALQGYEMVTSIHRFDNELAGIYTRSPYQ